MATKNTPENSGAETPVMKNLGNLRPAPGSHRSTKRLGRGIGSGLGKTAGRGHKGMGQRKSGNVRPGYEGGQMPLYMRLPKRGFISPFKVFYNVINLDSLERFAAGSTVDAAALNLAGLLRDPEAPVKLLGRGSLDKKLQITVHKASASAKEAVEKAGGTLTVLGVEKRGAKARAKLEKKRKRKGATPSA